ncbi:MAG TPA: branched-chain amino acid ABC transporter permease [Acetobacteraceae bacterium]|nr:branched-chain amino acid ABC transporter permease [Acetobacteraceae bacterium]
MAMFAARPGSLQRWQQYGGWAVAGAALALPAFVPNAYVMGVITRICLYSLLALGLNVVVGFAGLLDLGYVAFFGIGSYVYAFLASPQFGVHMPFPVALAAAVLVTSVFGILIGAPTLRLRGDYLAIVTLGFGEITYILLINLDRPINITGGPSGIVSIDPPSLFGYALSSNSQYYYLFLLLMGIAVLLSRRLRDSRVGWAWQAIREDEMAAQAMGINTTIAKLQAFAIGAAFAGAAGCLLASWQRSVFPDNFLFTESINILAMVILGGVGSLPGVLLGAAIIVALPEVFRDFQLYRLFAFGLMLMVLMIFRPNGLLSFEGRREVEDEPTAPEEMRT